MLQCVKCKKEVINSLLCNDCVETESMGKDGGGGYSGYTDDPTLAYAKPKQSLGNKCKECNSTAMTLKDGICNTCLSKKDKDDEIQWPSHYNTGKIQPIDAIEDWKLDFRLASALKYIARAGKKDPTKTKQDLEKCIWYIQRYIDKELNDG